MGLRLDLLDVLRPAKLTHVTWHIILNHHACARLRDRRPAGATLACILHACNSWPWQTLAAFHDMAAHGRHYV